MTPFLCGQLSEAALGWAAAAGPDSDIPRSLASVRLAVRGTLTRLTVSQLWSAAPDRSCSRPHGVHSVQQAALCSFYISIGTFYAFMKINLREQALYIQDSIHTKKNAISSECDKLGNILKTAKSLRSVWPGAAYLTTECVLTAVFLPIFWDMIAGCWLICVPVG